MDRKTDGDVGEEFEKADMVQQYKDVGGCRMVEGRAN